MKLPALLLSKIVVPESFRGPSFRWSVLLAEDLSAFQRTPAKSAHKIRNPAPSAGHNHSLRVIPRDARLFYPVLIRRLTIGSVPWITSDPTVNPLHGPTLLRKSRTICNLTTTPKYVKSCTKLFSKPFHTPVEAVKNAKNALWLA